MTERGSSSASPNYVFVKIKFTKTKKHSAAKRVFLTSNLPSFKKSCKAIFKEGEQIKAFYNEEGEIIKNIKEMEPGTTIWASLEEPKCDAVDLNEVEDENAIPKFDPTAPLMYAEPPKSGKVKAGAMPQCLIVGFPTDLMLDQSKLTSAKRRKQKKPKKKRIAKEEATEEEEEYEIKHPGDGALDNSQFHFFEQRSMAFTTDGDTTTTSSVKPQRIKKVKVKTRFENVKGMLTTLFADQDLFPEMFNIFNQLTEQQKQLLGEVAPDEALQKQSWIGNIKQLIEKFAFCPTTKGLFLSDDMYDYVKMAVDNHRFICCGNCTNKHNIGIVGPPKSGKSTMLQMYAEESTLDLAATDNWKSTFIYFMNMKELLPLMEDFGGIYIKFVQTICECIAIENPSLTRIMPDIRRYFESLIKSPTTLQISKSYLGNPVHKRFQENLTTIGEGILNAWNDPASLEWWYTMIFELPNWISKALGFKKTLIFVDNVEYADIKIEPKGRFARSNSYAYISEHFKHALKEGDYVFACENMYNMYDMLPPIDEDGVDMLHGTDFLTTNGITEDITENDPPLAIQLRGETMSFILRGSDCDGIPNYILLWNDLNQNIDSMEGLPENSEEREDMEYFSMAHAQAILDLLFVDTMAGQYDADDETKKPLITGIHRMSKEEQEDHQNQVASAA